MKRRAERFARATVDRADPWRADRIEQYRHNADNLRICSCWMCGNPRKWFGERDRRELLAEQDLNQREH